jgi:hypothetical protein
MSNKPDPESKIRRVIAMVRERGGEVAPSELTRLCGSLCEDESTTRALRAELAKRGFTKTRIFLTEKAA